jgi:hypothetical protein
MIKRAVTKSRLGGSHMLTQDANQKALNCQVRQSAPRLAADPPSMGCICWMAIFSQTNNLPPSINNVVIVRHQQQAGKLRFSLKVASVENSIQTFHHT